MKNKYLYNQKNKEQLLDDLKEEPFTRVTLSFYKYTPLANLKELRDYHGCHNFGAIDNWRY